MTRASALLLAVLGAGCLAHGVASAAWPEGLEDAAALYRGTLNTREELVRDGTPAQPRGIEEALQFDRETHGCHRGPAHAYRDYGDPLPPAEPAKRSRAGAKVESVRIRYPYRVFYRQALTLEALFDKPWKEGSGGAVEVEFQRTKRGWEPGLTRETLGDPTKRAKPGAGEGAGRGGGRGETMQPGGGAR